MVGVLSATTSAFIATLSPKLIGVLIDGISHGAPVGAITLVGALIVAVTGLECVARGGGRWLLMNIGRTIEYEMRRDLFAHLQTLETGYFQKTRTGDLMARMTNDLTAVRQMNSFGFMQIAQSGLTFVFTAAAMAQLSGDLTLVAIALVPFAVLLFAWIGNHVNKLFAKLQEQFGDLATRAQESFSGVRVVKAFAQENAEIARFARLAREYAQRATRLELFNGSMWPAMMFLNGFGVLVILYFGGQRAIAGEMSIGQLFEFVGYMQLVSMPMALLGEVINMFQQGWASLGRLQVVYNAEPTIEDPAVPAETQIHGSVEMHNVTFSYGAETILRDISFSVPAGGSLAVVGTTGAGKSTLVGLVPRLFDATGGRVLIDGVDVRDYPLRTLRRAIGFVPQETFLFSVPLRSNVSFGTEADLTPERLDWAGEVSQLNKDVIDFPARYDTRIGERGVTLSGGQKQRTAIARAVAKDPRILILDDALSAVDTYTEAEILRRLRGVMRERTSIIVAHRISTVKDCDEILVLDDGRIAERGDHQSLLAHGGLYARMYRRQLIEEELGVDEDQEAHEKRLRARQPSEPAAHTAGPSREEPLEDGEAG